MKKDEMKNILDTHLRGSRADLKEGDIVEGRIIELSREGIYLDLGGQATGIARGPELVDELMEITNLKMNDKVLATVIEKENEKGLFELSFRLASHQKAWKYFQELMEKEETISVKVINANQGGLIIQFKNVFGFLPVSHLSPGHYPRVERADRAKILEKLKQFINQTLLVKIIGLDEKEERLIVSERKVSLEKADFKKYQIGEMVLGKIIGLIDFGAFVKVENSPFEGLIHISELGWQRVNHPSQMVSVGQKIKAQIIGITEDGKFSLSIKRLIPDPWEKVQEKYKLDQEVVGKIIQISSFGFFVELDPEIHGLCHFSEISAKENFDPRKIAKIGDQLKFKIISLEPSEHRLGLSLKMTD